MTDNSVIVGPVRLSYLHVFKARKSDLRPEPTFEATLLIPKKGNSFCEDPDEVLKKVAEGIKSAAVAKFGATFKGWRNPLKDGDKELNADGEPKNPGYWYINSSAKQEYPPVLIDGERNPAKVEHGWVSGDWGHVKLSFYGFDNSGNKGVGAGLRAIQFIKKDEPLGGDADPEAIAAEFNIVANADKVVENPATGEKVPYDPFEQS